MSKACGVCGEVDCSDEFHVPTFEQILERAGLRLFCSFGASSLYVNENYQAYVSRKWRVPILSLAITTQHERHRFKRPIRCWNDEALCAAELPAVLGLVN